MYKVIVRYIMTKRIVEPCPICKSEDDVVKLGMSYTGRKRYACKKCHKSYYTTREGL